MLPNVLGVGEEVEEEEEGGAFLGLFTSSVGVAGFLVVKSIEVKD